MLCPNCNSENSEGAKFCKKCGTPLKSKTMNHENLIDSMEGEKSNNTTKIIIIALVIVAIVLAGAFVYLQGFGASHNDSQPNQASTGSSVAQPTQSQSTASSQSSSLSGLKILGGSFSTGSAESDKTYASIYVGSQYAGKDVVVQIWYSRDGSTLNNGNMVPVTVHSDGYIEVASADAYHYYPDHATINIYDSSSNLLDSHSVSLSPTSGTQTF